MIQARQSKISSFAAIVAACVAGGAIAGCGGSSAQKPAAQPISAQPASTAEGPTRTARATPGASNADVGGESSQRNHGGQAALAPQPSAAGSTRPKQRESSGQRKGSDQIHSGQAVQQAIATPGSSKDDQNPISASQFDPCTLVSLSRAEAITRGGIADRIEAPLGPTCIFKSRGSKRDITVAVELVNLSQVTRGSTKKKLVLVGGLRAYCVRLGTPMLFVPLSGGRLLNVTAPCRVAREFAAQAVGRLET